MMKLFPFDHTLELILRRRWTSLLSLGLTVAMLILIPYFVWGTEIANSLYASYPGQLQSKGLPIYTHNQSFAALLHRFFSGDSFRSFSVGMVNWTIFTISKPTLQLIATSLGILLSSIAWLKAHKRKLDLDYASATCFSILFLSHIVWKPYFIFLLPALMQVLLTSRSIGSRIGLSLFLILGPLSSPDIWGVKNSRIFDGISIHLMATIILFLLWIIFPMKNLLQKKEA